MRIKEVSIGIGRTIPDPFQPYANLRPSVTLTAIVGVDEDPHVVVRRLQAAASLLLDAQLGDLTKGRTWSLDGQVALLRPDPDADMMDSGCEAEFIRHGEDSGGWDLRICSACGHYGKDHEARQGRGTGCLMPGCSCTEFVESGPTSGNGDEVGF